MSDNRGKMNRRDALRVAGVAAVTLTSGALPTWATAATGTPKKLLLFLRVVDLPDVTQSNIDQFSKLLVTQAAASGISLTVMTDGSSFTPSLMSAFDAVIFYSTADVTIDGGQGASGISASGKSAFLKLVSQGKGIIAMHVGLPVPGSKAAATSTLSASDQLMADAKLFAPQLGALVSGTKITGMHLADHNVKVKGATVNGTPMPLRIVSLKAADGKGKSKYRPVLSVLYSNGGSLLKNTLQSASA